jgi:hypothetical protein
MLPPMNTKATRRHWSVLAKEATQWRDALVPMTAGKRPPQPLGRARIVLTRCSASKVEPDFDNLVMSFKPIVDALTTSSPNRNGRWISRADVLADDSPKVLERVYRWEQCPLAEQGVTIEVEEIVTNLDEVGL